MIPQRVGDIAPERIAMMMPPRPAAGIGPMNARLSGVSNSYLEMWLTRHGLWSGQSGLACRTAMQSQEHAIKVGDFSSCTTVAGSRIRRTRTIGVT
jgi:hypothetical protein